MQDSAAGREVVAPNACDDGEETLQAAQRAALHRNRTGRNLCLLRRVCARHYGLLDHVACHCRSKGGASRAGREFQARIECVQPEKVRVPPVGGRGSAVGGLAKVGRPLDRACRKTGLGNPARVGRNVPHGPVHPHLAGRLERVWIVQHERKRAAAIRDAGNIQRRPDVSVLVAVASRHLPAVSKRGARQMQRCHAGGGHLAVIIPLEVPRRGQRRRDRWGGGGWGEKRRACDAVRGRGAGECKMDWWGRVGRSGRKRHGWRRRAVAARGRGGRGARMPR